MKIAIAGSEIIDRGHAYVPQMRALVGNNLIASPGARAVIRRRSGAEEVLLHRRRDFGVWALPAGSPLIGESILDCLRREVFEETDLRVAAWRCFGFSSDPVREIVRYPNGDVLHCYSLLFEVELEDEAAERDAALLDQHPRKRAPRAAQEALVLGARDGEVRRRVGVGHREEPEVGARRRA